MRKAKKNEKPILSQSIILRRKAAGYRSGKAFAKYIGLPQSTLRDIEAGISGGWETTLDIIAKGLGLKDRSELYVLPPISSSKSRLKDAVKEALSESNPTFTLGEASISLSDIGDKLRSLEEHRRDAVLELLFHGAENESAARARQAPEAPLKQKPNKK